MLKITINKFINGNYWSCKNITRLNEVLLFHHHGLAMCTYLLTYESNQLFAEFNSGNHGWLFDRYSKNYPGQLRLCY
ncbi:Uncharacterised protein [Legionella pneumophila subsp. pascullei]|uniref:Uncharacterized protein n=1 Tax=Legionella pneumophila subsp. pascullei TaxID=91890 RepID=A0AAX2ITX5_LEGPN|nr:Uncharacterised protein [Legionella pneumophila subsp. pascullei]VEH05827.1 Uncharacterised protein [Legionella pneumophila subsp. pascullei]